MADGEALYSDALAWARARKVVLSADYYGKQPLHARHKSFSISGIARLDQLQQVKKSLDDALATGQTFNEWKKTAAAKSLGLPAHRLDNIFRTNIQSAYTAGIARQQESPAALEVRPYFQYDAINDSRTRPSHAALDNVIAPADSPFWRTHTPVLGFRCRCVRISLSEAQARARGYDAAKPLPDVAPDPGFAGHPLADEGWAGVNAAMASRRNRCDGAQFTADGRPFWCHPAASDVLIRLHDSARDMSEDEILRRIERDLVVGDATRSAMRVSVAPALTAWTEKPVSVRVNALLRTRGVARLAGIEKEKAYSVGLLILLIDEALHARRTFFDTVYRGVKSPGLPSGFIETHKPGRLITYNAYTAATTNPSAAYQGDVIFVISQASGGQVSAFSVAPDEFEFLIPRGVTFMVDKVTAGNGKTVIEMRQLADGVANGPSVQFAQEDGSDRARKFFDDMKKWREDHADEIKKNPYYPFADKARYDRWMTW